MNKLITVFLIAGSVTVLPLGPTVKAQQDPREHPSKWQLTPVQMPSTVIVPRGEMIRSLNRGDILMPNDPLLVKMAEYQERSQRQYKSMTFEQKAIIERYKPRKKLQEKDRVTMHREIVARYSLDGKGELQASLISDSDKKAFEKYQKEQAKKQARGERAGVKEKSLAEKLISPILFPMTTENVQKCKFTVLLALPEMLLLRFEPEPMNADPIFSGQVFVNPQTGEIHRLEIDALYNFEKIEKRFKYVKQFNVAIDYPRQPGGYRFPSFMQGKGFAKVLFFKGDFRFEITESGYTPASAKVTPAKEEPVVISSLLRLKH